MGYFLSDVAKAPIFAPNDTTVDKKKFNRLKVVLAEKGKTGRELGKLIGVGDLTISRWVTNARQPDLETLYKIAEVLEVAPCDLLEGGKSLSAQRPETEQSNAA